MTTNNLKSPFPYPGGKSDVAAEIWARLGDCPNYVEPMAGSAAVLLARPHDLDSKTETLNDVDGMIVNALRSIMYAPDETAYYCDRPVSEACLTGAHLHLKVAREELTSRLCADIDYCDPRLAGLWLWGIASWIGDGWCVADGPWVNVDGRLVDRRTLPEGERVEGVTKQMPNVGAGKANENMARGVMRYRNAPGVPRKMPNVTANPDDNAPSRRDVQALRYREGVPRKIPQIGRSRTSDAKPAGIEKFDGNSSALLDYFARLSDRLRRVRFLCGDWRRAVKDSVTVNHGVTGIFLDPPYPQAEHDMAYHAEHGGDVWYDAAAWAVEREDDPRLRICVAGYFSEATDALFPATWTRYRWQARGGYANQKADGRGRENAKRECLWFSPHTLDPTTDYGPLFAGVED